ncbi:MAG: hypothetical protein IRY99_21605, partial [Isosphaeraceae bacterium]|nr:hypothetical protein [Isosphaeraceae bacterium]
MRPSHLLLAFFCCTLAALGARAQTAGRPPGSQESGTGPASPAARADAEPPTDWVEPATGHRVIRLSREPGTASLYFHQNAYTESGDKMVVTTPRGLSTINLKTRAIEPVVEGRAGGVVVGKKTRQVFYTKGNTIYATHLDTRETRQIAPFPPGMRG